MMIMMMIRWRWRWRWRRWRWWWRWWWWWFDDDDDDSMMMIRWWWFDDDDSMMMIRWWWFDDDDDGDDEWWMIVDVGQMAYIHSSFALACRGFGIQEFYTQKPLHRAPKLLHKTGFAHRRGFYTQMLLYIPAYAHRRLYKKKFYTEKLYT